MEKVVLAWLTESPMRRKTDLADEVKRRLQERGLTVETFDVDEAIRGGANLTVEECALRIVAGLEESGYIPLSGDEESREKGKYEAYSKEEEEKIKKRLDDLGEF